MPEGDIIFLLGAGASVDAGFPDVAKLTRGIRKCLTDLKDETGYARKEFPELFEIVGHNDPVARNNYERFIEWIALIRKGTKHPFHKLITFDLSVHLAAAASELAWVIADPIRDILSDCHHRQSYEPDYLAKLGDFIPEQGRLDVFTSNYDLCVEDALAKLEIDLTTGFCCKTGEWSPSLFFSRRNGINLYKMHGSLNWHQMDGEIGFPREVYPPKWNQRKRSELVLGPGSKLQHDEPFVTLYSNFHRALRQAKICVMIGCSLQDKHIRGPLKEAAWRGVHLVNVGPQVPSTGSENRMGFKNDHYWPMRSNAKDALNGGIQRKLSSIPN